MNYLPTRESDLKNFALNFATRVVAEPANYGLTGNDATAINTVVQNFVTRYDLTTQPATRTKPVLMAKNAAKEVLLLQLRRYGMVIKSNLGLNDSAKAELGLNVPAAERVPVTAPTSHPIITVVASGTRQHELRFSDDASPESWAKPAGARGLQLFRKLGDTPPESALICEFVAFVTRSSLILDYQLADEGKRAWYIARWQTATGLMGPWSVLTNRLIGG